MPVVAPRHRGRQRHQDRLGAPLALQAEQRATVPHEVEFDVAAAPVCLELALAAPVREGLAALDDRHVRVAERVTDGARDREAAIEAAFARSSKKMPPMPRGSRRCFR
jgi:hypothetical protein